MKINPACNECAIFNSHEQAILKIWFGRVDPIFQIIELIL